jgi:hypothetical protein
MSIPKLGKASYLKAKTYCPISLSSIMWKLMEELVDRHIRDESLGLHPLHQYQFAYQPGKSTDTTQHPVIIHIEESVEKREVTLRAFLGIEAVFDRTQFDITETAKWQGLGDMICQWPGPMLGGRKITATFAGETLEGSVARGCLQGGVLSLLQWGLVVNKLIRGLDENSCYTVAYADGIAILMSRMYLNTVSVCTPALVQGSNSM